jgi:hypothetical protein
MTDAPIRCARCGTGIDCGARSGADECWCMKLPPMLPLPSGLDGCYCAQCLELLAGERPFPQST